MRIAIVNDLKMAVEILRRIVASQSPRHEVAWIACDGKEALDKCLSDRPDLILMDLIMPVMDGAESTRLIMQKCPCPILIVTVSISANSSKVFDAMGYGALDAVNTPSLGNGGKMEGADELLKKISRLELFREKYAAQYGSEKKAPRPEEKISAVNESSLIAIASSTGGPAALVKLLAEIPSSFSHSIVIIQHIDKEFSPGLVKWLSAHTKIPIAIACEGEAPLPGKIYLAGTNDHMVLSPALRFKYVREPLELPYRPSADVFFESILANWPRPGAAVLLTGIGRDGAKGLLSLKKKGWATFAQDKDTCVVYGMPKAASELGAADSILSPEEIGRRIAAINFN